MMVCAGAVMVIVLECLLVILSMLHFTLVSVLFIIDNKLTVFGLDCNK
jgi:hypothetical protein